MRIGILTAGHPPTDIPVVVPTYSAMICAALGPGHTYREFDVTRGNLPGPKSAVEAYVITGSEAAVYDREPWIGQLRGWLREVDATIPLVGICFGHQIMAETYGGVVEKSNHGWLGGFQEYTVRSHEGWMGDVRSSFILPVAYQDQVVRAPCRSRVLASNDLCPYAALSYTHRRALSFQAHPEFALDYARVLIDRRQQHGAIKGAEADRARESLRQPNDCALVIGWIRQFLNGAEN
jgi:GMP synthase-like glutamine amidotransferase